MERLPGFAAEGARKNLRFTRACVARALDSGCKPAEDALKREGATVSRDPIANARQYRPFFAMIAAVFMMPSIGWCCLIRTSPSVDRVTVRSETFQPAWV